VDGILPAVKLDCRLDPLRLDREESNHKIDDRIIVEIRRAEFMIADVTKHRPSVYFEAGFAMALGRPVIWTCQDDDFANVHFDTRQYPYIRWTSPADLREQLRNRVQATIPSARARLSKAGAKES
jgi:nucleoside 2-deoxyribosyltransferase